MRVLIAGGGTGGHLFPGLAVADELRGRGADVSFVGTRRGMEARVVPRHGYPLEFIDVAGLKGKGGRALREALRLPGAAWQALRLLRAQRPCAVIGVGGYASGPVVALAALLRIPTVVLEQNSVPGVTNRILGRLVCRVFIAFPEAARYFPTASIRLSGNPIRRLTASPVNVDVDVDADADAPCRILVLGGSQGARALNELLPPALAILKERGPLPRVRHQTGPTDADAVRARYAALGFSPEQVHVDPFIDDMAAAYAAADLVVGRAGATTLAELTALGLPSVLIPFPAAADDHQTRNARYLEAQGAARVLVQAGTTPADLAACLHDLCADPAARQRMAAAARALGRPHAAAEVAEAVLDLIAGREAVS